VLIMRPLSAAMPSLSSSSSHVALVTGAAGGIGRCIAETLALQRGVSVYVLDRNEDGVAAAVQAIAAAGGRAAGCVLDLADSAALPQRLPALFAELGTPDMLVNNAGIAAMIGVLDYPLEHWQQTLAINVTAPMLLTQYLLPHMRAKGWGRVVNVASISGLRAGSGRLAYGTSKAALITMTQQFAIETAAWGVTVNAIAPGPVDTPLTAVAHSSATRAAYDRTVPMRRYGTIQEMADAVLFLLGEQASYITGQTLAVDGGFMAAGLLEPTPSSK